MPDGKTKTGMREEEAEAANDHASASPLEMKTKRKQWRQKKTVCAVATARGSCYAFLLHRKTKLKKKKEKTTTTTKDKAAAGDLPSPSVLKQKKKTKKTKGDKEEGKSQIKKVANGGEVDEDQSPLLFLVVRHAALCPAYSLYKIKHTLATPDHPIPVPCHVKYLDAEHDMSFAALSSQWRSWIVGVGGFPFGGHEGQGGRAETIVYDCKTGLVAKGPRPTASKYEPILAVIDENVYALARMPSTWKHPDFPPWFEVLDLSGASCVDGQLTDCAWMPLPPPPLFFPILNDDGVRIDTGPPIVEVESYAVVGHYILLSIVRDPFTHREAGTLAFDTKLDEWHYVDRQKNLPFIGEAIPYHGLYIGRSRTKQWDEVSAYKISITNTRNKKGTAAPGLSIVEVPITTVETTDTDDDHTVSSGQFISYMGHGVICAVSCSTQGLSCNEQLAKDDIYIYIHSCVDGEEDAKTQLPREIVISNNPAMYGFHVLEPIIKIIAPSLVAALPIRMI